MELTRGLSFIRGDEKADVAVADEPAEMVQIEVGVAKCMNEPASFSPHTCAS
jgi:hypothetical protein